jgi:hypothetical protein
MTWIPSLLLCHSRPIPKVALETNKGFGFRSPPRSLLFLSPETTGRTYRLPQLRENSLSLVGKIPGLMRRNLNDDHPNARGLIRPDRKPDDNVLPPTRL